MSEQDNPDSKQKTVTTGRDDSSNPTGLLQLDQNLINLQDVHQQLVDSSKNQHSGLYKRIIHSVVRSFNNWKVDERL